MRGHDAIDAVGMEEGTIVYYGHLIHPPGSSLKRKKLLLALVSEGDEEILGREGLAALRQARILRLCRGAQEQGALLAYEDLTTLLSSSLSTIKRDLRFLGKEGFSVSIYRKKQRAAKRG